MKREILKTVIKCTMTCRCVEEFFMDYLEGRLDFWTRVSFKFHLLMCPDCSKYMREYKNTIALGKTVFENPDDEAVGKVPDEILAAIMSINKTNKK
jgi:predicted anti-sigma-YlaC factor YlaD